jgi:hypothetical protein
MTQALEPQSIELIDIPHCKFTATGLELPAGLSFDQWERIGRQLQLFDRAARWWIGDWLVYGEHRWREKYAQAIQQTGKAEQTLMNYHFVAKSISSSRRREEVDFSTHAEVASLEPEEQDKLLARAAGEKLSRNRVRREAEKIRRAKRPQARPDEFVLSREARAFLDEYMTELAAWAEKIPTTLPASDRQTIEQMIYLHGAGAMWQRDRTRQKDYAVITELFSWDEGTPGMERATRADIAKWLETCGKCMSDSDIDERLDLMVDQKMLQVKSVEDSRQEGRRGSMIDLYALTPEYQEKLEAA